MVNTPVLFETFVRVEYARQVFDAIKAAQPKKLYFYSNKGRADHEGEIEKNNEIRSWVNEIDWDCELHTWFRDECVDVYSSLKGAISWLFENEERGIVLEDDCVPINAFFSFCDQMLEIYESEPRVWCVSGDNLLGIINPNADYSFSRTFLMYGWATWRNRWSQIEWGMLPIEKILEKNILREIYPNASEKIIHRKETNIKSVGEFAKKTNCWDYAFSITGLSKKSFCLIPNFHLVTNIGMEGVHNNSKMESWLNVKAKYYGDVYTINRRPQTIEPADLYDYGITKKVIAESRLYKRILRFILSRLL